MQITSDYYDTTVYSSLFNALEKKIDLKVIVPLTIDKKHQYGDIIVPANVTSVFIGKTQIFGIQINASNFTKYIISNKINEGIQLVHAHYVLGDGSIAFKLYKQTGIPYLVSVRTSCIVSFNRKIAFHNYFTALNVINNAKVIFFQSQSSLDKLLCQIPKIYRERILKNHIIIPNGVDEFWHQNIISRNTSFNIKEFVIITAASIEYNKNLLSVAKVITKLNNHGYSIKYNIAGTVHDESIFKELIQNPHISYLGVLDREELLEAYRHSDIFVMVSHNETFGLAYVEAMSQGLPVIYSKGEGFDKQFEEGVVGYHASSDCLEEIEEAILKIAAKYSLLSENAVSNINKFDWGKIADKYCSIYSETKI